MYCIINDATFTDIRRTVNTVGEILFCGEQLDEISEVSGEIVTYRNDGFELARDNVQDYLRVVIQPQTIKLTNQPDVPPAPTEPTDTEVLNELLGV